MCPDKSRVSVGVSAARIRQEVPVQVRESEET